MNSAIPDQPIDANTCAIGIDVGGTDIKFALISAKGNVHFESKCHTPKETTAIVVQLKRVCEELVDRADKLSLSILGVGVGVPGLVDDGLIVGAIDNIVELEGQNLQKLLQAEVNLPVLILNDADAMASGEHRFGAGMDTESSVFLTIGTGVGGAVILNGKLFSGHWFRGGEIGHLIVRAHGLACTCGAKGCLEAYASTTALIKKYAKLLGIRGPLPTGHQVIEQYLLGQAEAVAAMDWHFDYLSIGVANLINLFNPQKVVLGGGIVDSGEFYLEHVRDRTKRIALPEAFRNVEIVSAKLGNLAGSVGSAASVFELLNNT